MLNLPRRTLAPDDGPPAQLSGQHDDPVVVIDLELTRLEADYRAGALQRELADKCSLNRETVGILLSRAGVQKRRRGLTAKQVEAAAQSVCARPVVGLRRSTSRCRRWHGSACPPGGWCTDQAEAGG